MVWWSRFCLYGKMREVDFPYSEFGVRSSTSKEKKMGHLS